LGANVRIRTITSKDNPRVKQVRSLRQRNQRQATGLFLVEGIKHIGEAAEAASANRVELDSLWYAPDLLTSSFAQKLLEEQAARGVPCFELPRGIFESLAEKENPQGILAVVKRKPEKLFDFNPADFPWVVSLVSPQDPGNVGTILRTIDAVGASGLVLIDSSVDPHHPACVRASMGALFWYPVVQVRFDEFTRWATEHSYRVYGASTQSSREFREVSEYLSPLILLMGSERTGLTDEQASSCDFLVRLPMQGRIDSLNLSVATGVLLYDIYSKRGGS
jgi:RNA methyltransferase, TrmH family